MQTKSQWLVVPPTICFYVKVDTFQEIVIRLVLTFRPIQNFSPPAPTAAAAAHLKESLVAGRPNRPRWAWTFTFFISSLCSTHVLALNKHLSKKKIQGTFQQAMLALTSEPPTYFSSEQTSFQRIKVKGNFSKPRKREVGQAECSVLWRCEESEEDNLEFTACSVYFTSQTSIYIEYNMHSTYTISTQSTKCL